MNGQNYVLPVSHLLRVLGITLTAIYATGLFFFTVDISLTDWKEFLCILICNFICLLVFSKCVP